MTSPKIQKEQEDEIEQWLRWYKGRAKQALINIQLLETGSILFEHREFVTHYPSQRVLRQIHHNAFDSLTIFVVSAHEEVRGHIGTLPHLKKAILTLGNDIGDRSEQSKGIAHRIASKYADRGTDTVLKQAEQRRQEIVAEFKKNEGYNEVKGIRNKRVAHFDKPDDWSTPLQLQQDKLIQVARLAVRKVEVLRRAWECTHSGLFNEIGPKDDAFQFWKTLALGLESRK